MSDICDPTSRISRRKPVSCASISREFGAVRTEMRTEFQAVRTAIEASKRWMIVAGAGLISTALGALAALGRVMKWL